MPAVRLALSRKHPCLWVMRSEKIVSWGQDACGKIMVKDNQYE